MRSTSVPRIYPSGPSGRRAGGGGFTAACRRWCWFLAVALPLSPARAQGPDAADTAMRVGQVRVVGNDAVSAGTILNRVHSRSGSVYNEKTVAQDARRILIMPQIADVTWEVVPAAGRVDIVFTVVETPQIDAVEFRGVKHFKQETLGKELPFTEGDFLDRYLIGQGGRALEAYYHDKGYYFARVQVSDELLESEHKVVYLIVEGPKLRIAKRRFVGAESLPKRKLKGKIKTNAYFPVFSKGRLDDEQLEQDRLALQTYYRDEGFLDARVFYEVEFNDDKTRAEVTFVIQEGARYTIDEIQFTGNENLTDAELLDGLELEAGKVFTRDRQIVAQRTLKRLYGRHGYIYAQIQLEPGYTEQEGLVNAVFRIDENAKFYLGRVIVRGNDQTQDKVVRRAFDYYDFLPGGIYNTDAAEKSRRRLLGSGGFENVNVLPIGNDPNQREALVEVQKSQTGLILFGVGVDTNSGVLGQFAFEQRDFDASRYPRSMGELFSGDAYIGGGQRLKLSFSPGTRVTTGYLDFYEPYLFDQPYYMDWMLMIYRRWREAYLENRRGGRITFGHRFWRDWSAELSLRLEEIRVADLDERIHPVTLTREVIAPRDVQDVEGSNFLTSLRAALVCDKTDSIFRPSQGYKFNVGWEQVGALGGDFSFASLSSGATYYRTVYMDITERRTVWASGIRGSYIVGDAPVFERFYAGGIGSLRGFDYRGVSPRDGIRDYPVGSDFLVLAGTELTHPLFEETVFGKLFCDTGLVDEGPYRMTVGFGLELVIPQLFQMVPMHFDFGFPIRSDDLDDEEVFSFSFGMTF